MKHRPTEYVEARRVTTGLYASTPALGNNGKFHFRRDGTALTVVVSDGGGWDHVSVSCTHRCPTWPELCWVKDLFFDPDETVIQYHPAESEYVNNHPNCLHMWKPQGIVLPTPPSSYVGLKELNVR